MYTQGAGLRSDRDGAAKGELRGAGHIDVVVGLAPLDVQGAARQVDAALAVDLALQDACVRAGVCALVRTAPACFNMNSTCNVCKHCGGDCN